MSRFGCEDCEYEHDCIAFTHTGLMEKTGICPFKKPKESEFF